MLKNAYKTHLLYKEWADRGKQECDQNQTKKQRN